MKPVCLRVDRFKRIAIESKGLRFKVNFNRFNPFFLRVIGLLVWAVAGCATLSPTTPSHLIANHSTMPVAKSSAQSTTADILIFAPHPDDEVLACAGVIQQALAAGLRVQVVTFTHGDSFPLAATTAFDKPATALTEADMLALGRLRQAEEVTALRLLGLTARNVLFLGYADGGLSQIYQTPDDRIYTHPKTQMHHTYGLTYADYHTLEHGAPAAYCRSNVVADVARIIEQHAPTQIYVTHPADTHPDHRAAFWFVRDAIRVSGYRGALYGAMIHAGSANTWPKPGGATPEHAFAAIPLVNNNGQALLAWPAPHRTAMTPNQAECKLKAIRAYRTQIQLEPFTQYLESFVKNEEIFWPLVAR